MNNPVLHEVYKSVVVSKLRYASCTWRGFAKASDKERLEAFIKRSKRTGFCSDALNTFSDLCELADDKPFKQVNNNPQHVLHQLLPSPSIASQNYNLRPRSHSIQLPIKTTHLAECAFITRSLYKNIYWLLDSLVDNLPEDIYSIS